MLRTICYFVLSEIAIFATGTGMLSLFPEWEAAIWFAIAAASVFVIAVLWRISPRKGQEVAEPSPVEPVGVQPIQPADTITPHGVLTMGPTGYPERLTTWDALREGAMAPPPGADPASLPVDSAGVSSSSPLDELRTLWLASPGAGRLAAELICKVADLEAAREIWEAFYAAPRRTETRWAYWAFASRLQEAGHGQEVYAFAFEMTGNEHSGELDPDEELETTVARWSSER